MFRPHSTTRQANVVTLTVAAVTTLIVLSATGLVGDSDQTTSSQAALPFDPPSLAEQEAAAAIALDDQNVQDSLNERHVFLGAALHTKNLPGTSPSDHNRLFDVWFYDYSSDRVIWTVVDPTQGRVNELVPVDESFQPPLAGVEVERAVSLAANLDAVNERHEGETPEPVAMIVNGEGTACPTNRCALVAFTEDGLPQTGFMVLVNLSEDRVERIVEDWEGVYTR